MLGENFQCCSFHPLLWETRLEVRDIYQKPQESPSPGLGLHFTTLLHSPKSWVLSEDPRGRPPVLPATDWTRAIRSAGAESAGAAGFTLQLS